MDLSIIRQNHLRKISLLMFFLFALVFCGIDAFATETVEDDFNDGIINVTLWTEFHDGANTLEEAGGVVKASDPYSGELGGNSRLTTKIQLVGDFDVWTDYSWFQYEGDPNVRNVLRIYNHDETEVVQLNNHRWASGTSREIILQRTPDGNVSSITGSFVPLSGKLRIRREGAMFYGYCWISESESWHLIGQTEQFTGEAYVALWAKNTSPILDGYPFFELHWDNFHAEAEQITHSGSILVSIDVKPGSDPNSFNINGHGVIPVAILGSADFDVTNIDTSTFSFAGLSVRVRGNKGPKWHFDEVNGDLYTDLVCQFEDDPSNWNAGNDTADLTGNLFDGTPI